MTDREKRIAEIRERHKNATPGPWEEWGPSDSKLVYTVSNDGDICQLWYKSEVPMPNAENNAKFISHSWADVDFLLSELERYEGMYQRAEDQLRAEIKTSAYLRKERDRMEKENQKLKEERNRYEKRMLENHQQAVKNAVIIDELSEQLQIAQQEIKHLQEIQRLWQEVNPSVYEMYKNIAELKGDREKLIKGLRTYLAALYQRYRSSQLFDSEGDMYAQGAANAYNISNSMLRELLLQIGVDIDDRNEEREDGKHDK
jgi:uncharacterized protein YqfB (UPF0267 family)